MRLTLAAVFLLGLGCKATHPCHGPGSAAPCGPAACAHQSTGKPCALCAEKEVKAPVAAPVAQEQAAVRQAAVTQDILLIPRTVYVPYAPQVPVAPARLAVSQPALRADVTPEVAAPAPVAAAPPPVAAPPPQLVETLEKCRQLMEHMDQRLTVLEHRVVVVPGPQPCPPCPPVGPICKPSFFQRFCRPHLYSEPPPGPCDPVR